MDHNSLPGNISHKSINPIQQQAMSMMRPRGLAESTYRPRLSVLPVYEDFKPLMESKEDAEARTVYIHLSGFLKEQIRIVAESSPGLLRVRGERLAAGNTWSRFSEEIPVPGNCDITQTRAKFEGGILRITMPKRIYSASPQSSSSPAALSDEATTSWPPAPPRPATPPHPVPSRPVAPPPPRPPARTEALPPTRRPAAAPRPEDLTPQRTSAAVPRPEALPPPRTQRAVPRPRPRTPEPRLKQSPPQPPRATPQLPLPQPEAARFTPSIHPKPREHEKPQFEGYQKPSLPLPQPPPPPVKYSPPGLLQALPQPDPAPRKDPIASDRWMTESNMPAPSKDPDRWRTESNIPVPPKAPVTTAAPGAEAPEAPKRYEWQTEAEKHRKGKRGVSLRGVEEDRQLVVNMAVAVMVIVALGAGISYSFGSSANPWN